MGEPDVEQQQTPGVPSAKQESSPALGGGRDGAGGRLQATERRRWRDIAAAARDRGITGATGDGGDRPEDFLKREAVDTADVPGIVRIALHDAADGLQIGESVVACIASGDVGLLDASQRVLTDGLRRVER